MLLIHVQINIYLYIPRDVASVNIKQITHISSTNVFILSIQSPDASSEKTHF